MLVVPSVCLLILMGFLVTRSLVSLFLSLSLSFSLFLSLSLSFSLFLSLSLSFSLFLSLSLSFSLFLSLSLSFSLFLSLSLFLFLSLNPSFQPTPLLVRNTGQYPDAEGEAVRMLSTGPMVRYATDLMPMLRIMAGERGVGIFFFFFLFVNFSFLFLFVVFHLLFHL